MIPDIVQPYFVLGVVFILFISLYLELTKPTIAFLLAVVLLLLGGAINTQEILDGLANESVISIALLILITAGISTNFNLVKYLDLLFKKATSYRKFLALMMTKVAVLSSFINNTPVVALMTPYVFSWGKRNRVSPSKLLIPLSYATIVGGMITLVGTSTTLVLNGFMVKNELSGINVYHLLIVGSIVTISCILFLILFADRLLPTRQDLIDRFEVDKREYLIEKRLNSKSELIGKSVKEGGLRNLKGVYLVEIVRGENILSPVGPDEHIQEDDVLIFAGNTDSIIDNSLAELGIELPPKLRPDSENDIEVVEVVVSTNNSMIGKTIKESNFRERYNAAVVAIHRNGERLSGKLGRMTLKAGDVLLLYVGKSFYNQLGVFKDLYLISGETKEIVKKQSFVKPTVLISVTFILLITQYYSLFISLLLICALMVSMQLITLQNVKRDLDLNMLVILVLSLSLGQAMINSGGAVMVSDIILNALQPYGNSAVLVGLMLITAILTSIITNVGAISISFPLAYSISTSMALEGDPLYLGIAFAASAAFVTPIGYQTNLIVYGPGGYSFKDFLVIGIPMTVLYLSVVFMAIMMLYPSLF